jgi:hypothetical protein
MEGLLDVVLALIDPGDEVLVTDPTYGGIVNRIRLAAGVPRFVPFHVRGRRVATGSRHARGGGRRPNRWFPADESVNAVRRLARSGRLVAGLRPLP